MELDTPTTQSPIELKIKAKSLAAEARIIRQLEKRLKRRFKPLVGKKNRGKEPKERPGLRDSRTAKVFFNIQGHRKFELRYEARATHLARAFLKGLSYLSVERVTYTAPPLVAMSRMVTTYAVGDERIIAQRLAEWVDSATKYWNTQATQRSEEDRLYSVSRAIKEADEAKARLAEKQAARGPIV